MKRLLLYTILFSTVLTSCSQWKNYQRPEIKLDTAQLYRDSKETDTLHIGQTPWKEFFTDAQLQTLIEKALQQNADLQKAELTIQQAKSGLKVARLAFLPSLTFAPSGTLTSWDFGKAVQAYSFPLQAQWQIDAFGAMRNEKKMSEASFKTAQTYQRATQTAIISGVANLYYTLEMLREQLSTTKATIVLWEKNVEVMKAMHEADRITSAAVAQAEANLLQLQSSVPTLQSSIYSAENALCLLLQETPHEIATGEISDHQFPEVLKVGVPINALANRPDVQIAELQLAKAFYNTQKAKADFYPKLTLSGAGAWTNQYGMIINPGKILANAMAQLVQPLFAKGKLTAQLKIAKAQQEAATIDFQTALLKAGNEVSNALFSCNNLTESIDKNEQLVNKLKENVETTDLLFQHNTSTSYLETLTARQQLLQAQLKLISLKFDKIQQVISLYQALGGGQN